MNPRDPQGPPPARRRAELILQLTWNMAHPAEPGTDLVRVPEVVEACSAAAQSLGMPAPTGWSATVDLVTPTLSVDVVRRVFDAEIKKAAADHEPTAHIVGLTNLRDSLLAGA